MGTATVLATLLAVILLPSNVNAFWPFSTPANAAPDSFIPSSSTPTLAAATNSNPNAGAPLALSTSGDALVSNSGPSGTVADVPVVAPPSDRISVYVVRPGDTLSQIAAMYDVSVNTIFWANDLKSVRDVHPGDTLIILPVSGVEHTVVKGDTLKSIAGKYHADPNEIAVYNGLNENAQLAVGSTVIIPGGEISAPPAPARTTSAGRSSRSRAPSEPYLGGSGPVIAGYFRAPVPGGIMTQGLHGWNAVDIAAARGTRIHAAAAGTVIIARDNGAWNGGYGNYVVITHGNGTQTLYAHMSRTAVRAGQSVSQGQVIGYVGMTGMTTGPHVHFEIRGAKNLFAATCRVGEAVGAFGCGN